VAKPKNKKKDEKKKKEPPVSQVKNLVNRFGNYAVGFLGALGALVIAVFMPEYREMIIGAAASIAAATFWMTEENEPFGLRLLGMFAAGVVAVFAFFMPDHAKELLTASGSIAGATLIFT
jgi:hypothetical protein